ncbi:uncharacterized protein LOC135708183 isoform X2 [Ochlerotatus camptorhynchus]|uniref:uncharacterized protein LOC135708183 isoform X2 n=1 Tax=Ochlerotatus camptorhynchus TaxID=644619 RepID=UPI0031D4FD57
MASFKATIIFAVVALFAIVSAIPAPQQPAARQPIAPGAGPAPADDLDAGSEDKDLKGASSFGYGYYGYPNYYGGYYGGYPGYGYGYGGGYPYYRYGGLYGGYWY